MAVRSSGPVYEGQRVTIECEFRVGGVLVDPLVVQCIIAPPDGGQTTLSFPNDNLIKTDVGTYEAHWTLDAPGTWWFRFAGNGGVDGIGEAYQQVERSNVGVG